MSKCKSSMLSSAICLAAITHSDQKDKGGAPYILHPLRVMDYLKHTGDYELMSIAVLHDVVEDAGDYTDSVLSELDTFSSRVMDAVLILTKEDGQTYEDYIAKVCSSKDAITVKMADIRHNLDVRRLKGLTERDFARVVKYQKTYKDLEAALHNIKE